MMRWYWWIRDFDLANLCSRAMFNNLSKVASICWNLLNNKFLVSNWYHQSNFSNLCILPGCYPDFVQDQQQVVFPSNLRSCLCICQDNIWSTGKIRKTRSTAPPLRAAPFELTKTWLIGLVNWNRDRKHKWFGAPKRWWKVRDIPENFREI